MKVLRRYPFEFFAAFLVFMLGLYGLIEPTWPPSVSEPWEVFVLNMEALYFVISGGAVMSTFFFRHRWPVCSIVVQMFAWLFVGFAGIMALIVRIVIPDSQLIHTPTELGTVLTSVVWFALIGASFTKYFDIRLWYKSGGHKK